VYHYVYFLINLKNEHYIGCTNNLKDRIKRHNLIQVEATKNGTPWKLKSCFIFDEEHKAFEFEQYLKTGAGRGFAKRHKMWE
jgi:putative endonuclease